eukprot:11180837-Alexandrium_andersonii.AAC.1
MLEELAKNQKSTHGNGPGSAESDPLPDYDRWREYLEREHVQSIEPPPGGASFRVKMAGELSSR